MPDRQFLLTLLYTMNPEHEVFSGSPQEDRLVEIPLDFLEKAKFVDPDQNASANRLFKLASLDKHLAKKIELEKRGKKKNRRVEYLLQTVQITKNDSLRLLILY